ncbi:hypothetical protein GWK48_10385 [Metallosphaera tengchongensis]|uniref:Cmr7b-like BtrG-like domain-containing protein n=1 Tax=Metallosphaera tengchongensis TaxID=1532350 RepID=A0A6N0P0E0_9CREN|nr:hypothetical protein [Metallosphaera tengchongensis]QKR00740.1 hypothetical protein GWK48_10385 [Metallosphaera tengchongensis]
MSAPNSNEMYIFLPILDKYSIKIDTENNINKIVYVDSRDNRNKYDYLNLNNRELLERNDDISTQIELKTNGRNISVNKIYNIYTLFSVAVDINQNNIILAQTFDPCHFVRGIVVRVQKLQQQSQGTSERQPSIYEIPIGAFYVINKDFYRVQNDVRVSVPLYIGTKPSNKAILHSLDEDMLNKVFDQGTLLNKLQSLGYIKPREQRDLQRVTLGYNKQSFRYFKV